MPRISIELVPRTPESICADLQTVGARFPQLDTVNIPDLERFPLRSWEACALARPRFRHAIAHLRARDVDTGRIDEWLERLERHSIDRVIVVRGDPPGLPGRPDHATTSVELIDRLRRARPRLRIYAALDPYRGGPRQELESMRAKRDAGADGFFSQPFFDLRLMEIWREAVGDAEIYWGISPVTRAASKRYWETKNGVVFPAGFDLALEANQAFARCALAWAQAAGDGVYFMPIREDPSTYLEGVLDQSEKFSVFTPTSSSPTSM